jgi:hypothetical protein
MCFRLAAGVTAGVRPSSVFCKKDVCRNPAEPPDTLSRTHPLPGASGCLPTAQTGRQRPRCHLEPLPKATRESPVARSQSPVWYAGGVEAGSPGCEATPGQRCVTGPNPGRGCRVRSFAPLPGCGFQINVPFPGCVLRTTRGYPLQRLRRRPKRRSRALEDTRPAPRRGAVSICAIGAICG